MNFKTATLAKITEPMDVYVKWTRFKGKANEISYKTKSYPLDLETHQVNFEDEVLKIPRTHINFNEKTQQYEE